MRTLIKKEIRLLLPAWTGAMLLAVAPAWLIEKLLPHQNAVFYVPPTIFIGLGLLLLGISSFGQEFSAKTFSLLLAQPAIRTRTWRLKITLLAIAFGLVSGAAAISWTLFVHWHPGYSADYSNVFNGLPLLAIAFFSGGLWTTLLLRQEIGAFWVTLLFPAVILLGVIILASCLDWSPFIAVRAIEIALIVYSATGFLFARRLFLHAQDIQWSGGNIFFWRRNKKERATSFVFGPIRNHFVMLLWKEIQLHETNLFIAAIFLVVSLAVVGLVPFISDPELNMAFGHVLALWLLMPLLIGCAAVAEERRLGVAEFQLCQPVSRRAVFFVKFLIALAFAIILGAAIPAVIERICNFGIMNRPGLSIFFDAVAIFFVSFYVSTFSRSTVYALGTTVAVSVAGFFAFLTTTMLLFRADFGVFGSPVTLNDYVGFGHARLMAGLSGLIFPFILTCLAFWNFKWLHTGWKQFWHNAVTILISLAAIGLLTNLIYDRPWELLSSIETPRGPVRLSETAKVNISACPYADGLKSMTALLPDGRLWQQGMDVHWTQLGLGSSLLRWDPRLDAHRYVGSNWLDVSCGALHILGIQRNGRLWRIPGIGSENKPTQIGSDTNWLKVAANGNGFMLLKKDGTLWVWGTSPTFMSNGKIWGIPDKIKSDLAKPPHQIDSGTNWTNFMPFLAIALAQKSDGSFWSCRQRWADDTLTSYLVRQKNMDNQWISFAYNYNLAAEIKTNGQLWLFSQKDTNRNNGDMWDWQGVPPYTKKTQLGSSSDWKSVSFGASDALILLRNDGTLWKLDDPQRKPFHPVQLGRESDWVLLQNGIALGADGSLWSWDAPSDRVWLAPSRRPLYMGNIFEGASVKKTDTHENTD